jgi:hypothetical protein
MGCRAGRAALLRAAQTPLEPLPAQQCPARAGQKRATRRIVGSRSASDGPDTWTQPRAGTDPCAIEQVAASDDPVAEWPSVIALGPSRLLHPCSLQARAQAQIWEPGREVAVEREVLRRSSAPKPFRWKQNAVCLGTAQDLGALQEPSGDQRRQCGLRAAALMTTAVVSWSRAVAAGCGTSCLRASSNTPVGRLLEETSAASRRTLAICL